jgi:hypothetical protein
MPATLQIIDSGTFSVNETAVLSGVSWPAGVRGYIWVCSAAPGGQWVIAHAASGAGVTWTELVLRWYAARRSGSLIEASGTPNGGEITLTASSNLGGYQETRWVAFAVTGVDPTTPRGTVFSTNNSADPNDQDTPGDSMGTTLSTPDLGTIEAGDLAVLCAAFEGGADGFAAAASVTEDAKLTGGANVRSVLVGHSTSDDTPGVSWNTVGNGCGVVGVIFKAAAGGGGMDLAVPFAAAAGEAFTPGISLGVAATAVAVPFAAGAGQDFAPAVDVTSVPLAIPFSAAAGADHAPSVDVAVQTVTVPFAPAAGAAYSPAIDVAVQTVATPFAAAAGEEFAPVVEEGIDAGTVLVPFSPAAGAAFAPSVVEGEAAVVPFAAAEGQAYIPTLAATVVAVQVPFAAADGAGFPPGLSSGSLTVLLPFSPGAGLAFAPSIAIGGAVALQVLVLESRLGRRLALEASYARHLVLEATI